jgi:hypothetical protein
MALLWPRAALAQSGRRWPVTTPKPAHTVSYSSGSNIEGDGEEGDGDDVAVRALRMHRAMERVRRLRPNHLRQPPPAEEYYSSDSDSDSDEFPPESFLRDFGEPVDAIHDTVDLNFVLRSLAEKGEARRADAVFATSVAAGAVPNLQTFNHLLLADCHPWLWETNQERKARRREARRAQRLYRRLRYLQLVEGREEMEPNSVTVDIVVRTLVAEGGVDRASKVFWTSPVAAREHQTLAWLLAARARYAEPLDPGVQMDVARALWDQMPCSRNSFAVMVAALQMTLNDDRGALFAAEEQGHAIDREFEVRVGRFQQRWRDELPGLPPLAPKALQKRLFSETERRDYVRLSKAGDLRKFQDLHCSSCEMTFNVRCLCWRNIVPFGLLGAPPFNSLTVLTLSLSGPCCLSRVFLERRPAQWPFFVERAHSCCGTSGKIR